MCKVGHDMVLQPLNKRAEAPKIYLEIVFTSVKQKVKEQDNKSH